MWNEKRERMWERTFNISLLLLVKGLLVALAFAIGIGSSGCDKPYLPWNAGPSWSSSGAEQPQQAQTRQTIQREIENFCEDNRETVEAYRRFLAPDYDWNVPPTVEERRRRYTQQFVDQYDAECN